MEVVNGIDRLEPEHGPAFVVVGVFDGLHRGHAYLLDQLVGEARRRAAAPTVITFDHHPDEVLLGSAPPLLIAPDERLERLAAAGVAVTVVQHFDESLRRTTFEAFVDTIRSRVALAGFLVTPDAAFGFERRGTPAALTELGRRAGFDVVVVPPFDLDGRAVRSTEIREAIATGRLDDAAALLGRPFTLTGVVDGDRLTFAMPMALPPDGTYAGQVDGRACTVIVDGGRVRATGLIAGRRVTVGLASA